MVPSAIPPSASFSALPSPTTPTSSPFGSPKPSFTPSKIPIRSSVPSRSVTPTTPARSPTWSLADSSNSTVVITKSSSKPAAKIPSRIPVSNNSSFMAVAKEGLAYDIFTPPAGRVVSKVSSVSTLCLDDEPAPVSPSKKSKKQRVKWDDRDGKRGGDLGDSPLESRIAALEKAVEEHEVFMRRVRRVADRANVGDEKWIKELEGRLGELEINKRRVQGVIWRMKGVMVGVRGRWGR